MQATLPQPSYVGRIKSIAYTVPSSEADGEPHVIACDPRTRRSRSCSCKAGSFNRPCWARKLIDCGRHTFRPHITFGPVEDTAAAIAADRAERHARILSDLWA